MEAIAAYIEQQTPAQQQILYHLHDYFLSFPNISVKKRYRIPFYDQKTWICYTNAKKKTGVELVFLNGRELSDYPTLEARGRKMVKGILYQDVADINYEILDPIWMEALSLDMMKK
jgi:hypothetical protein